MEGRIPLSAKASSSLRFLIYGFRAWGVVIVCEHIQGLTVSYPSLFDYRPGSPCF
jgi:hypothetical protein